MIQGLDKFPSREEAVSYLLDQAIIKTKAEADKYFREHLPKESYYQKKIMDAVQKAYPEAFIWKEAAGAYSRQGIPDVSAIIEGKYYGFEVKRPYIGVLSKIQEQTIKQIRKAGGCAGVVVFPEDALRMIEGGNYDSKGVCRSNSTAGNRPCDEGGSAKK